MNLREEKLQLEQRLSEIEKEISKELVFLGDGNDVAAGTLGCGFLRLGIREGSYGGQPGLEGYTYTLLTKVEVQGLINELTKYVED